MNRHKGLGKLFLFGSACLFGKAGQKLQFFFVHSLKTGIIFPAVVHNYVILSGICMYDSLLE